MLVRSAPLHWFVARIRTALSPWVLLAASCTGGSAGLAADDPWIGGIPRDQPSIVTIENLQYEPLRAFALVRADHPAAASSNVEFHDRGIKRTEVGRMNRLLDEFEARRFLQYSAPVDAIKAPDRKTMLRRLIIQVGDQKRVFTLPRGPKLETAEAFNQQALAFQAMFNETLDLNQEILREKSIDLKAGAPPKKDRTP